MFRQAAQIHSDWVNDILLCRQNQMRLYHLSLFAYRCFLRVLISRICLFRRCRQGLEPALATSIRSRYRRHPR